MSDQTSPATQDQLLAAAKAAQQVINAQVFEPAFFAKLAEYGEQPRNEAEKQALLQIGQKLLAAEQHPVLQKLAEQDSAVLQANAALDDVLASCGISAPEKTAAADDATEAGWHLAQNQLVADSARVLRGLYEQAAAAA